MCLGGIGLISTIFKDILGSSYKCFWNAFVLAFFFMFFYNQVYKYGLKKTLCNWKRQFCKSYRFRKMFLLAFYVSLILGKTLLLRSIIYEDPCSRIFDGWQIVNTMGQLRVENVENALLFIPLGYLVLLNILEIKNKLSIKKKIVFTSGICIGISVGIEEMQLISKLGTFQISDIIYNTLGSILGIIFFALVNFLTNLK